MTKLSVALILFMVMLTVFSVPTFASAQTGNPYNHPTQTLNLYMRSDTYNYSTLIGYGLDSDYTNSYVAIPVTTTTTNATVTYGFRIYLAASATTYTELTGGVPEAEISISGNQTVQTRSSGWNCPDTAVVLGAQLLKVDVYAKIDNGSYTVQATYISNVLMSKELMATTWTLSLNLQMTSITSNTTCLFSFGDTTYRSTITGVTIVDPNYTDIQTWQWMQGDIIGLILGSYLHLIGPLFWVLIYVMIFGGLWFRHRSIGPVAFIVVMLGGTGSLGCWVLMPPLFATVFSILIIIAIAAIVFKIIR